MSLYEDLGIPPNATPDEIKKAGRDAAKKNHPDKPGGDHDKFVKSQNALRVLMNPDRRAHYDRTGEEGSANPESMEQAEAQGIIAQLMNEIMTGDARYTNLPKMIIERLEQGVFDLNSQTAQAETKAAKQLATVESYLTRLKKKKKGGDDILRGMLMAQKVEAKRVIESVKAEAAQKIRIINRAKAMAGGYEYEVEKAPPSSAYQSYGNYGNAPSSNDLLREIQEMMRKTSGFS